MYSLAAARGPASPRALRGETGRRHQCEGAFSTRHVWRYDTRSVGVQGLTDVNLIVLGNPHQGGDVVTVENLDKDGQRPVSKGTEWTVLGLNDDEIYARLGEDFGEYGAVRRHIRTDRDLPFGEKLLQPVVVHLDLSP